MASTSAATFALSAFFSPQIRTSSSRIDFAVGELGRADRVEGGDDGHAVGDHLLRLLRGGALPDAERAGRLARDGGRERDRAVDQELAGLERVLQVREVLGLRAEGHGEDHDRALLGGLGVRHALDLGVGHGVGELLRGLGRALRVARAEHDRAAGERPAQARARSRARRCRR